MSEENKIDLDIENVVKQSSAKNQKLKKHQKAKALIEETKSIMQESDNALNDCKLLLNEDIREYTQAVESLKKSSLNEAKELLLRLHDISFDTKETDTNNSIFEPREDIEPLQLKDISSGRFTGFVYALLGGAATLGALVYWATKKMGIKLEFDQIPPNETIEKILGWFGAQVGKSDDAAAGGIVLGGIVLGVMMLVYLFRVGLKASSNLRFAQKQMEKTQEYISQKSDCRSQMEKVDAHIKNAVKVLKDYEVMLAEQKGKLQRIFHFEKSKRKSTDFSQKSMSVIKDTQGLIEYIERFVATPMSNEGRLSKENEDILKETKEYAYQLLKSWN